MVNYYLITAVLAVINLFILIFIFEPKKTNYYFLILMLQSLILKNILSNFRIRGLMFLVVVVIN